MKSIYLASLLTFAIVFILCRYYIACIEKLSVFPVFFLYFRSLLSSYISIFLIKTLTNFLFLTNLLKLNHLFFLFEEFLYVNRRAASIIQMCAVFKENTLTSTIII